MGIDVVLSHEFSEFKEVKTIPDHTSDQCKHSGELCSHLLELSAAGRKK